MAKRSETKLSGEQARMRAIRIRALLDAAQIRQVDLAAELACSRSSISMVIAGQASSTRIEEHIARRLGMPAKELWSRYGSVQLVNALTRPAAMSMGDGRLDEVGSAPPMKVAAGA